MKKIGKIILTLAMIFSPFTGVSVQADQSQFPFTDVTQENWYYEYVYEAYQLELMTGKTTTTFDPYANMTRGQVATVLYRMAGSPEVEYTGKFKDVPDGKYYSDAVEWASDEGIITGYILDNTFRPGNSITRQDFALMMYRYVKNFLGLDVSVDSSISLLGFKDNLRVSLYAREALRWAYEKGIMTGKTIDGTVYLCPKDTATRAECCKMLVVTYDLIKMNNTPLDIHEVIEGILEVIPESKESLIEILEISGYSEDEIQEAIEELDIDWNEQALAYAQFMISDLAFSKSGLTQMLEDDGFTEEEVAYAMDHLECDWNEQAVRAGEEYLDENDGYTKEDLNTQLLEDGFTEEEVQYALDQLFD